VGGVALKGLTVDFHEPGFAAQIGGENGQPFYFQMGDQQQQKAGSPWGPAKPQALNRYSYVQNNPIKYTDPSGHVDKPLDDMSGGGEPPGGSSGGGGGGGALIPVGAALAKLAEEARDIAGEVEGEVSGLVTAVEESGNKDLQKLLKALEYTQRFMRESLNRRELISNMPAEEAKQNNLDLWNHQIVDAAESMKRIVALLKKQLGSQGE
jgi:hypothetical protein